MKDKQYIKVTICTSNAAREYYYTPSAQNDANLESGKQYTYNITVKKDKLAVTVVGNSVQWDSQTSEGDLERPIFRAYLPTGHGQTLTPSGNAVLNGSYYEVTSSSFSISYTVAVDDVLKGFPAAKGLCDIRRSSTKAADGKITSTFTYSNIRSDLWLEYKEYMQVGDLYYSDGSVLPFKDGDKTCIGVVFYLGRHASDDCVYPSPVNTNFHGYVVALRDAGNNLKWEYGPNNEYDKAVGASTSNTDWKGYGNQKKIEEYVSNNTGWDMSYFPAANACKQLDSPTASSGWFLPSAGQLKYMYDNRGIIESSLGAAGGSGFGNSDFWSSTEYDSSDAWGVGFSYGGVYSGYKDYGLYVRGIFAF